MTDGGTVYLEGWFSPDVRRALEAMEHNVGDDPEMSYGGYQAILFDANNGVYRGASESRKDGQAAGF